MTFGRPPATAPRGRVTLAEASEISGLSRQEIHRRITIGQLAGEQSPAGVWTIARKDAEALERRPPAAGKRIAVMLRPVAARHAAWKREARRRGLKVSQLAGELLDGVSGWEDR